MKLHVFAALLACTAPPVLVQDSGAPRSDAEWVEWVPDPDTLVRPRLEFAAEPGDIEDYDKYYYFHRPETAFAAALADLRECDALSRGLSRGSFSPDTTAASDQYGLLAGAVGGAVVGALGSLIFGSAEARLARRVNMRRCMFFKGYARYGLRKSLWETFNFEEGLSEVAEQQRQTMLAQQALVASGDAPRGKALGL